MVREGKGSDWRTPASALAAWPHAWPLLYRGGAASPRHALALEAAPLAWEEWQAAPLGPVGGNDVLAVLPYWDALRSPAAPPRLLAWRVTASLDFDVAARTWRVRGEPSPERRAWLAAWRAGAADEAGEDDGPMPGLALRAREADEAYLAHVAAVREEIRAGRFYQLNLLRRYDVLVPPTVAWLRRRLTRAGGAWSAWVRTAADEICSFSPERFVAVDAAGGTLEAFPIKGTCPRHADPARDAAAAASLLASPKDRAELAMIIDLMRHDLQGLCRPHSVTVPSGGHVSSSETVHHLEGHVRGALRDGLTWGDFLRTLLPAGSITGAPKAEVMAAIAERESEDRGFFMGNVFHWDAAAGRLESSVLIRTLWRRGAIWRYAAGSGLVLDSRPAAERDEVDVKGRIVTAAL